MGLIDWLVVLSLPALWDSILVHTEAIPREKEKKRYDMEKNVQTTSTRTYSRHSRPLSYTIQIRRAPRH